ncbi:Yip1-like protein [Tumebacillus sp. BK434]|uniref:YIP1 family protein n=1 Tax=Tumebacillus sp. BK434 TaxID=2512169 RepID=UPI0010E92BE3|nr:YIP1 family protein [Tumebacillus sp. BK434]TCP55925.1 Yip1-like protein [Tumebacillus sp. BK434]
MGNILGVLTQPAAAFERLRGKGGWVLTLILLTALSVLALWLQGDAMIGTIDQELSRQAERGQEIPETVRDLALASALGIGYVTAALSIVLTMFIGGLLLLLVNLFVRGEATYMQLSKVALYSYIPTIIGTLLTGIIAYATGATSLFDVSLTAGAFVSDKTSMLFVLAQMVNPFAIWSLVLMIIGTSVMTRKGRGSVATWIVIGWAVVSFLTLLGSKAA